MASDLSRLFPCRRSTDTASSAVNAALLRFHAASFTGTSGHGASCIDEVAVSATDSLTSLFLRRRHRVFASPSAEHIYGYSRFDEIVGGL